MLEGRLWITKDNQNFLGCGRISLLEQIQITGSIHAAAKAMKMSYKTAWDSIDAMNNLSDEPLVVRVSGGKGGGGTHLTSKGKEIIEAFHNLEAKHQQFLELLNSEHDSIEKIVSVVDRLSLKLSARNQIIGKISSLKADAVNVVVELTIKNFDILYSSITLASFDTLGININEKAIAIIKASSILLSKDKDAYEELIKKSVRHAILYKKHRVDGRGLDDIRAISCEVDTLPRVHGSALFTRGETQSLTTVTLGTKLDEKIIDDVLNHSTDRFLLHYNFPPFSTGEARPQRGTGRREIGHGNLAHRALKRMIPQEYPYVIRVVSDILESNGSSSMATVCAGTLALMDAGVQMIKPVSGIAMGLISENKGQNFAVLSDILGDEDHLGDMDFKICGTKDGITATQMDIKVDGLSYEILEKALAQAKAGREHIMGKMMETLSEPRIDLKPHAPRIEVIMIPKDYIGAVIGPGGKIIQGIQEETGAIITIQEIDNQGRVEVSATNRDSIDAAMNKIKGIVSVPEVGEVYEATVRSVMPYGAFCEFLPGKDGLLHISEIDWKRLERVEDAGIKEGDKIQVKLIDVDPRTGKFKLSRKVLLERPPRTESQRGDRV